MIIQTFIPGTPVPQGSMRAFTRQNRAWITYANPRLHQWRSTVSDHIRNVIHPPAADDQPYIVILNFIIKRPKSHKKGVFIDHVHRPDIDKLSRAVLDALTGWVWLDDKQVVTLHASKRYGDQAGLYLTVIPLHEGALP